jgi:predicted outer membrane repeat protein
MLRISSHFSQRLLALLCLAGLLTSPVVASLPRRVRAAPGGNAVVNAPCGEAEFNVALETVVNSGGGVITFNCGAVTIPFTSHKVITSAVTVDGGGVITLDGGNHNRLFYVGQTGHLTLRGLVLTNGNAIDIYNSNYGGAVRVENGGRLDVENSTIRNSHADWAGGAIIDFQGIVTLTDSVIEGNSSNYGAINSTGTLTLIRTVVRNNTATLGGGGLSVGGTVSIQDSTLENNVAPQGGALFVTPPGNVTITRSTFNGNRAEHANPEQALGGAIISSGRLLIEDSTFDGNRAQGYGGALVNGPGAEEAATTIRSVTFTANQAAINGGAIDNRRGPLSIANATLSGNSASAGGAIQNLLGPVMITYTTLAGNTGGALNQRVAYENDERQQFRLNRTVLAGGAACAVSGISVLFSQFLSGNYNLAEDGSCAAYFTQAGDRNNTAPQLGALADNGGATLTHLPQPGSPLVDAAACLAEIAVDQRGQARPQGAGCDIGAVDVAGAGPTPTPTASPTASPTATPTATPPPPRDMPPPIIHADLPGGIKPTIAINPNHGYTGQRITVSGELPAGFTRVRVTAVLNNQMLGMYLADGAAGRYSFDFIIPPDMRTSSIDLCATVTGAANAEFACAPLQIDPAPTSRVMGSLPNAGANAQFSLLNAAGKAIYSAPIQPNGAFALSNVQSGFYAYAITGGTQKPVAGGSLYVLPAQDVNVAIQIMDATTCLMNKNSNGRIEASPARATFRRTTGLSLLQNAQQYDPTIPFGIYVSGVTNQVTFDAYPQVTGAIQKVVFEVLDWNINTVASGEDTTAPWSFTFDVGRLPASRGARHATIVATPYVNGVAGCPIMHDIEVIPNPFPKDVFQPDSIVWDSNARTYRIQATIPYIRDILPADFMLPPTNVTALPYLGRYHNRLNAGIRVVGTLSLDGFANIRAVRAIAEAELMNEEVIPRDTGIDIYKPDLYLPVANLNSVGFPLGPYPLAPKYYAPTPFLSVPVITFFGLVDVTVHGSAGIGGAVTIGGYIQPLRPGLSAIIEATGNAHAELGVGLRLLQGLAQAGATSRVDAELGVPFSLQVLPQQQAKLDACLQMIFSVRAFAEAFGGLGGAAEWSETKEIAKYNGCLNIINTEGRRAFASEPITPSVPTLLASPAIAIAPDGTQLSAYVENTAAPGATPQVQVLARFRTGSTAAWSAPIALSDPTHGARTPVVGFAGPQATPIVAWVENMLTPAEASALGPDLNAHLRRQEIAYSTWNGTAWSAPVYLTADQVGDGLPALAASSAGAVLAWTRDPDGNAATRADQRIAVARFDPNADVFGAFELLTAGSGGLNGDVQATYDLSANPPRPYLAWSHDADADLLTSADRSVAVAYHDGSQWVLLDTTALPHAVDSPAISVGAGVLHLAFLVREASADGTVALLGANGVLWTALRQDGQWQAAPLPGDGGGAVYAERPILATLGQESLLLFRRFESGEDNSSLGQLALSQQMGGAAFSPPLYLTDEPRENWLPALAVSPLDGVAAVLKVARTTAVNASTLRRIGASQSTMAAEETVLNMADAPVDALTVATAADPAMEPLTATATSPAPGEVVTVTVTVRNLGRGAATGVTVALYAGEPGSGALIASAPLPHALVFGESFTLQIPYPASGGEQTLNAMLTITGENQSTGNDRAALTLGHLSTPVMGSVTESGEYLDALAIAWVGAPDEYVSGYRILRGDAATGPFELVGEASINNFTDVQVTRGREVCYAVEAYNANSFSTRSAASCGVLPLLNVYLPAVQR